MPIYEFKKLSEVNTIENLDDNSSVLVVNNGEVAQVSKSKIGTISSVNGKTPDENGNVVVSGLPEITSKNMILSTNNNNEAIWEEKIYDSSLTASIIYEGSITVTYTDGYSKTIDNITGETDKSKNYRLSITGNNVSYLDLEPTFSDVNVDYSGFYALNFSYNGNALASIHYDSSSRLVIDLLYSVPEGTYNIIFSEVEEVIIPIDDKYLSNNVVKIANPQTGKTPVYLSNEWTSEYAFTESSFGASIDFAIGIDKNGFTINKMIINNELPFQSFSNTDIVSIMLPQNLEGINNYTFSNCSSLSSMTLPPKLIKIGYNAFQGCTNLIKVSFLSTPTSIDSTAFNNCSNLTVINVPWAENAVENAPWGATNATINYNYAQGE